MGSKVLAKAPRGKFYLDPNGDTPVVLVSAGVGLTPLISMLNAIVAVRSRRPTWFIHGSRNRQVHAFGGYVREVAERHRNVHAHVRYSRASTDDVVGRDYDDEGHVDLDLLKRLVPSNDCDFYLCGPTAFMRSLVSGLLRWGVREPQIQYEFFGPASALKERTKVAAPTRIAETTQCCSDLEIIFSESDVKTNWNPSFESILDLAEANGLSPDYSCRSGICRTCMCKIEAGEVEYVQEPLDPPDEGSVLICCSRPKTDIVVAV